MISAQSAQYLIESWLESGFGCPKSGHELQSLVLGIQSLDMGIQSLDLSVQSVDRPCTLADVTVKSLDLGVQSLDRLCTLAELEQNLGRHHQMNLG